MSGPTIMHDRGYVEKIYSEERRPITDYPNRLARYLKQNFFPDAVSMLDLGCGRGDMMRAFIDEGMEVAGFDLSPALKEINPDLDVHTLDVVEDELPVNDGETDVVFSKSVIEHIHNPQPYLNKAYRLLKPGGVGIFMTPSWIHNAWGPFYLDSQHVTPFTRPSLRDALTIAGFNDMEVRHFRQLPAVWKMPWINVVCATLAALPIPYSPMHDVKYSSALNKFIRFSNEVLLLAIARKDTAK